MVWVVRLSLDWFCLTGNQSSFEKKTDQSIYSLVVTWATERAVKFSDETVHKVKQKSGVQQLFSSVFFIT